MIKLMRYPKNNPHKIQHECVVRWSKLPSVGEIRKHIKYPNDWGLEIMLRDKIPLLGKWWYYLSKFDD